MTNDKRERIIKPQAFRLKARANKRMYGIERRVNKWQKQMLTMYNVVFHNIPPHVSWSVSCWSWSSRSSCTWSRCLIYRSWNVLWTFLECSVGASLSASLAQASKLERAWSKPTCWLMFTTQPNAHNSNHQPYHIPIPYTYIIYTYHTYIPYIHPTYPHPSPSTTSCSYKVTVWGYIVALVVVVLKYHAKPLPSCSPCQESPLCTHHHCVNVAKRYSVRHPYGIWCGCGSPGGLWLASFMYYFIQSCQVNV